MILGSFVQELNKGPLSKVKDQEVTFNQKRPIELLLQTKVKPFRIIISTKLMSSIAKRLSL